MKSVVDEMKTNGYVGSGDILKNYQEALRNECFSEFVSKLNLPAEKLMKYTTALEECSNNYYN